MAVNFADRLMQVQESTRSTDEEMAALLGIKKRMYGYYKTGEYKGKQKKVEEWLQILTDLESGKLQHKSNASYTETVPELAIQEIVKTLNMRIDEIKREYKELLQDHYTLKGEVKSLRDLVHKATLKAK